jgi:hypothetical protein
MSDGHLVELLRSYLDTLRNLSSRNAEGFDALLASASLERIADLIPPAAMACCRLQRDACFSEAMRAEADKLDAAARDTHESEGALLGRTAARVRLLANEKHVTRRGRPAGAFSSVAGAKVQAVIDAHIALGQTNELEELLEKGSAGAHGDGAGIGTRGKTSHGTQRLISVLCADDPSILRRNVAKAIKNARERRPRKAK